VKYGELMKKGDILIVSSN